VVNIRGSLVTVVEGWRALGQPAPTGTTPAGKYRQEPLWFWVRGWSEDRRLHGGRVIDLLSVGGETLEPTGVTRHRPGAGVALGPPGGQLFVVLDIDALLPHFAS
jgi:hypothetical protein